jgi:hypothetical protein
MIMPANGACRDLAQDALLIDGKSKPSESC